MISADDIKMELDEAEGYLAECNAELARAKFALALSLLAQNTQTAERIAKLGGPLAGITVAEVIDILQGGLDHPLLDALLGGIAGVLAGKAGAKLYSDTLGPMATRAYNGLGSAYRALGNTEKARECFAAALKIAPQDQATLRNVAQVS